MMYLKKIILEICSIMLIVSLAVMPVNATEAIAESEGLQVTEVLDETVESEVAITETVVETEDSNESDAMNSSNDIMALSLDGESDQRHVEENIVEVVNENSTLGEFTVRLSLPSFSGTDVRLLVPTWTESGDQDDIHWYEAEQYEDGWYITVDAKYHNFESGLYNMHFYSQDKAGNLTLITSLQANFQVEIQPILETSQNGNIITITLKNAYNISSAQKVYLPVWGAEKGQNDLIWYEGTYVSDGCWEAKVDLTAHKEVGTYNVHVYVDDGFNQELYTSATFDISRSITGRISVASKDDKTGTFRLKITDVSTPGGVKEILVPIWSNKNGQDDLMWYIAQKQGDAWYVDVNVDDHNGDTGKYTAHMYIYDSLGNSALADHTEVDIQRDTTITLALDTNTAQTQISATLYNYRAQNTGNVYFAVWGAQNGQNDIIWYPAEKSGSATWKVTIPIANHKEAGAYNIHVYEVGDTIGSRFITNGGCKIDGISSGDLQILNSNDMYENIQFKLENVTSASGISKVTVAVWTKDKGQDDLKWYDAVKQGNAYIITVPRSEHNWETGEYIAHAYAYDNNGISKLAAFSEFNAAYKNVYSCDGVYITDLSSVTGKFNVDIHDVKSNSSLAIQSVKVAVWNAWNGQDDLKWYEAVKSGDQWSVNVDTIKDHGGLKGVYYAHAYVFDYSGTATMLGDTQELMPWNVGSGIAGIDTSFWQGTINWNKVKESGIEFSMIRAGYGLDADGTDSKFYNNITNAKKSGIKVGVYYYSNAESVEQALAEADRCLELVRSAGVTLDYPIAFDFEEKSRRNKDLIQENTEIIKAFCNKVQSAGYSCIVYGDSDMLKNYVNYDEIKKYGVWLALWTYDTSEGYGNFENVKIWQYSNQGHVDGIDGYVDLDISFLK